MAVISDKVRASSGKTINFKVKSSKGGSDRTIYIENGKDTGYRLGNYDDKVYCKKSGDEVSSSLIEFIKLKY